MLPKRLVLMVEGEGDEKAVPKLVNHFIEKYSAFDTLFVDDKRTFTVRSVSKLYKKESKCQEINIVRWLKAAPKIVENLGAVLLLLDGDTKNNCVVQFSHDLAKFVQEQTRAGEIFSFAIVFARQEFESWILAGHPDFRESMTEIDVEEHPRDAKGKIRELSKSTYKETVDQPRYAAEIDLDWMLQRTPKVRSFHRLDHAISQIIDATRTGNHIVSPCPLE